MNSYKNLMIPVIRIVKINNNNLESEDMIAIKVINLPIAQEELELIAA